MHDDKFRYIFTFINIGGISFYTCDGIHHNRPSFYKEGEKLRLLIYCKKVREIDTGLATE